ncbi:hypothetical protein [Nocardia sp. NPDC052112]|uniref:hypothetical protein n=1 Tax=Nocardia sp. NPDC052112 TaxID=3155646 RepID=UPI0034462707
MIGGYGVPGPFDPNPSYVPADEALPTDPLDAVLMRLVADGDHGGGDEIIAALRDAVVKIGCDDQNELARGRLRTEFSTASAPG